jgi:hypothetical protein
MVQMSARASSQAPGEISFQELRRGGLVRLEEYVRGVAAQGDHTAISQVSTLRGQLSSLNFQVSSHKPSENFQVGSVQLQLDWRPPRSIWSDAERSGRVSHAEGGDWRVETRPLGPGF